MTAARLLDLDRSSRPFDAVCCNCGSIGHRMPLDPGWVAFGPCTDLAVDVILAPYPKSKAGFRAFCEVCTQELLSTQRGYTAWIRYRKAIGDE